MKKLFILILLIAIPAIYSNLHAQSGGRKRESKGGTKSRTGFSFKRKKSAGHADEFARGNRGYKTKFYQLYHKEKYPWQYKATRSGKKQQREERFLFRRPRNQGLEDNQMIKHRLNKQREKNRVNNKTSYTKKRLKKRKY